MISKSFILDAYSHKFTKIYEINLENDIPLEKTTNVHNAIILIKSVLINHNHYHYQTFSEIVLIDSILNAI